MIATVKAVIFSLLILVATTGKSAASDSTQTEESFSKYAPPNSVGLGIGLAFGGVGISYDRELNERVTLTAAIGDHPDAPDLTYQMGAKWFIHKGRIWQPRLTFLYGTNTYVNNGCGWICFVPEIKKQFEGASVGLGQRFILGRRARHSIDVDFFLSSPPSEAKDLVAESDGRLKKNANTHLAIGYRYYF